MKVGVLMGGPSSEHEVSLATGQNVLEGLDRSKYEPVAVKIVKSGQWFLNPAPNLSADRQQKGRVWCGAGGKPTTPEQVFKSCDVVFNALHGYYGEDGKIQALLDYNKVRYTGSGVASSAIAMDKFHSRELFKLAGFNVPKTLKLLKGENYSARLQFFINKIIRLPVVVKPCSNGSSVGVAIVEEASGLNKAVFAAFKLDKEVLVEEFIKGRELTCGVLDSIGALPVTEIIPVKSHKFFNYQAKYKTGHANELTPAPLDDILYKKAQDLAVRAHQILGCRGYSRTDMILKNGNGTIYVLETNTLPGLTKNSLLPKAAAVAGLSFSQLLDHIISNS